MGDIYLKTGDFVAAIREYTSVLALGLDHVVLCKRSLAFSYSGDARNAMVDARMSIALNAEYIKGYYCLANGHYLLNEYSTAMSVCQQGLGIAATDRSLLQMMEKCERAISGAAEPDPMRYIRGSMHHHDHDHDSGADHDHSHDHSHSSDGHSHYHDHNSAGEVTVHDHGHEHEQGHSHELGHGHSHGHSHFHDHNSGSHDHDHGHSHSHEHCGRDTHSHDHEHGSQS